MRVMRLGIADGFIIRVMYDAFYSCALSKCGGNFCC